MQTRLYIPDCDREPFGPGRPQTPLPLRPRRPQRIRHPQEGHGTGGGGREQEQGANCTGV